MDRIAYLREKTFTKNRENRPFYYHFYKHYLGEADGCVGHYGKAFYHAMSTVTPIIDAGELIVGQYAEELSPAENAEWEERIHQITLDHARHAGGGQDSHMAIDYEKLLSKGIRGILDEIAGYMATCPEEKLAFYEHVCLCLEGVLVHAGHYTDLAEKQAEDETDPVRKAELTRLAQTCRRVPEFPAESFYEAVQSVHFVTYCVSLNPFRPHIQQFQLGHPDRYLLPYYQADLAGGKITREEAQLLLDLLSIQMNLRVPNGLSSGYMVGGRDKSGRVVANDLTGMLMQVIDDIRLVYPSVGLCVTGDTPKCYLDQAVEILSHGRSHPAIFNDDVITKGLLSYGIPEEETHDYIHSTCVEITPCAASNVWVASPYTNMPSILLEEMGREYPDFDALVEAVLSNLDTRIQRNFESENALREVRRQNSMNPLLSAFVNDCLALGLDIEAGGARYNWIMPSFVGMANLVDALYALRELVFETKEYTMAEMRAIVESNFEGNELLRQRILHKIPKYGNDDDDVDRFFGFFTDHIIAECEKYTPMHQNGRLIPSVFCWVMHARFGTETGATPDGRPAGFPLGDGSGPCQGREMMGPTASVLSSTKWSHHKLIGGVAVNMKFSKAALGPGSLSTIRQIVETYLQRGGFEMQINIVDADTLRAAKANPEAYKDLVVRVGGYSDYFVKLSPEMQEEVLLRTAHTV